MIQHKFEIQLFDERGMDDHDHVKESPPPDDPIRRGSVVTKTFRRLRRGSRSPSPRSLLPAMLSKKNKSKSSADLTGHCDSAPPLRSKPFWGDSNGSLGHCALRCTERGSVKTFLSGFGNG